MKSNEKAKNKSNRGANTKSQQETAKHNTSK